jgi:hypothetical protein
MPALLVSTMDVGRPIHYNRELIDLSIYSRGSTMGP